MEDLGRLGRSEGDKKHIIEPLNTQNEQLACTTWTCQHTNNRRIPRHHFLGLGASGLYLGLWAAGHMAARPTKEWKAATVCGSAMGLTCIHPVEVGVVGPPLGWGRDNRFLASRTPEEWERRLSSYQYQASNQVSNSPWHSAKELYFDHPNLSPKPPPDLTNQNLPNDLFTFPVAGSLVIQLPSLIGGLNRPLDSHRLNAQHKASSSPHHQQDAAQHKGTAVQTSAPPSPKNRSDQQREPKWVWLKINQEGLRRFWSMFPLTRVPFWDPGF